ncbi:hypothetical protein HZ326_6945 [Fusarium oxysporum f. sp. albedinis]|nr:hypothetical protein HZ326_6945 [Fusarium oxysporum f. sp. albedinis]
MLGPTAPAQRGMHASAANTTYSPSDKKRALSTTCHPASDQLLPTRAREVPLVVSPYSWTSLANLSFISQTIDTQL